MNKQKCVQSIEIEKLNIESVMEHFFIGDNIVFITEQGKLVGAITEGDIRRYFRDGKNQAGLITFNRNITCIVDSDDSCSINIEANRIFSEYPKINSIPVVDKMGVLLYQLEREKDIGFEYIQSCLTRIRKCKPMIVFLECCKVSQIVLTGGKPEELDLVKVCLSRELNEEGNDKVSFAILTGIEEYRTFSEDTAIICLSDVVTYYLRETCNCNVLVTAIKEVSEYCFYKEFFRIQMETVKNFLELFGYEKIGVYNRNKYLEKILNDIEQCGVQVVNESNLQFDDIWQTDIVAYSMGGEYRERIMLQPFSNILKRIQQYNYIAEKPLSRKEYIKEYLACLEKIRLEGINGIIFKIYNLLDCEVYKMILEKWSGEIISFGENESSDIQWVDVTRNIERSNNGNLKIDLHYLCLETALVNASYEFIRNYCSNVYIHRICWDSRKYDRYVYSDRVIENYDENSKYFSADFVEKMYGNKNFPIKKMLFDRENCAIVRINEGYMKYQSNYVSDYFNTTTYGNRVTIDMPQEYIGTIWLMGTCIYSGYAVTDGDTVASILQKKLIQAKKNYRVVNLSLGGTVMWEQVDKIREAKTGKNDIVVAWVNCLWNRNDDYVLTLDVEEFVNQLGKDEYWDTPQHCGRKGYAILAEQILEKIIPSMGQESNRKFHLEPDIENEIKFFVTGLQKDFSNNLLKKSGAIVMNCNPFTYGHQYLVETVSRLVDVLYIFVVEEDKSVFPFEERLCMVREGVKEFSNCLVLPSGKFMISSVTFPGYFVKDNPISTCYDSFLDLKIFAHYIAPALNISMRFVGEEPFDSVTRQYNCDMKKILNEQSIDVIEIPRKKFHDEIISATKVRSIMETGKYTLLQHYVPDSTVKYIKKYCDMF